MFTSENTTGYTAREMEDLNAELAEILAAIDPDDLDARYAAEKEFWDEVARR